MSYPQDLLDHLASGTTSLCQCWAVERTDGAMFGFTDHDCDLSFDGVTFRADTGLTARALEQSTGLSVDNSEALGALSAASITEADLRAGRFDGAKVRAWLVNWANPHQRIMQFNGTFGEIARTSGGFRAELRGLTEALNQPQGRVFQKNCSAMFGDAACGMNVLTPGFFIEADVEGFENGKVFTFETLGGFDDRWFERGRCVILTGEAKGLAGSVKSDRLTSSGRRIELWQDLRANLASGDRVRFEVGCNKTPGMCRLKFGNFANFRGFPHMPGEDWLTSYPVSAEQNDGASLFSSEGS